MKGDTTRKTFRKGKHYSGVLKQQGRVDIDADWNEQVEIEDHLRRTAVKDTLGCCATPAIYSAFQISLEAALTDAKRLKISAGRMYVDGVLCENDTPAVEIEIQKVTEEKETQVKIVSQCQQDFFRFKKDNVVEIWDGSNVSQMLKIKNIDSSIITFSSLLLLQKKPIFMRRIVTYDTQDDYPEAPQFHLDTKYLIYLDVWQRHITSIEDKSIREIALGGSDTATRVKTLWQVKLASLKSDLAGDDLTNYVTNIWADITKKRSARMAAWTEEPKGWDDCSLSPAARYRGLDNHLYRVEIHDEGTCVPKESDWFKAIVKKENGVSLDPPENSQFWRIGQLVELCKDRKSCGVLSRIIGNKENVLSMDKLVDNSVKFIRKVATYKWSRDNGSILRSVESIDDSKNQITFSISGQDIPQVFFSGQWIEVIDEGCELREEPGVLVKLKDDPKGNVLTYDKDTMVCIKANCNGVLRKNFSDSKFKIRLWDHVSNDDPAIIADSVNSFELEYGINVQFSPDDEYKTGDYWQIPARSIKGSIEWPSYVDKDHVFVQRHGISHHYCRLAIYDGKGLSDSIIQSQNQFLPVSETITLSYIGGDAQEGFPGESLDRPLEVAVYKGGLPLKDATVVFTANPENDVLQEYSVVKQPNNSTWKKSFSQKTDSNGIAKCKWKLENNVDKPIPIVTATLPDISNYYNDCTLKDRKNWPGVQAIDFHARLCTVSLEYVSGDGQEALPGEWLPEPLEVAVFKGGLPFEGAIVNFLITDNGQIRSNGITKGQNDKLPVPTGPDGIAKCEWIPEKNYKKPCQQVEVWVENYNLSKNNGSLPHCPKIFLNSKLNVPSLFYVSGDSQEVTPFNLDSGKSHKPDKSVVPILLRVAADIGPLKQGAFVKFKIFDKFGGKLIRIGSEGDFVEIKSKTQNKNKPPGKNKILILPVNDEGIVECGWKLGTNEWNTGSRSKVAKLFHQTAIAKLLNEKKKDAGVPPVFFTANLNIASGVAFDESKCEYIANYCNNNQIKTPSVQDAIEALCSTNKYGGCTVTVGDGGKYSTLPEAIEDLYYKMPVEGRSDQYTDICICLLPGDHVLTKRLIVKSREITIKASGSDVDRKETELISLKISGCGPSTRINLLKGGCIILENAASFTLKDVMVISKTKSKVLSPIWLINCERVSISSCIFLFNNASETLLTADGGRFFWLKDNYFFTDVSLNQNLNQLLAHTNPAALILNNPDANVVLEDNLLQDCSVCMYGPGTQGMLSNKEYMYLKECQSKLQLSYGAGSLRMRGNSIASFTVSNSLLKALKEWVSRSLSENYSNVMFMDNADNLEDSQILNLIVTPTDAIMTYRTGSKKEETEAYKRIQLFQDCMFTENEIDNINNIVIARDLKMTSNVFKSKGDFLLALSESSIFMGNSAKSPGRIANISTYEADAANIRITII